MDELECNTFPVSPGCPAIVIVHEYVVLLLPFVIGPPVICFVYSIYHSMFSDMLMFAYKIAWFVTIGLYKLHVDMWVCCACVMYMYLVGSQYITADKMLLFYLSVIKISVFSYLGTWIKSEMQNRPIVLCLYEIGVIMNYKFNQTKQTVYNGFSTASTL